MKLRRGPTALALAASVMAIIATALIASPAAAAVDDSFEVATSDGCAVANFIDYGDGVPGGANNDDYFMIHDYCPDGHGIEAYVSINDGPLYDKYNGSGYAGPAMFFEPYHHFNVLPGDRIELAVCLVDGAGDPSPVACSEIGVHTSVDG